VYDLATGESQASVFGKDPKVRRDASPLFQIRERVAPFLITYCQWDYPTLPAQAREFHAALKKANVPAELIFVPRENHISEIVNVPNDNDPTAATIVKFILGRPQ
jgi:dipeptidyl aminopeptidase/acylaminoacyl peptidase